MLLQIESPSEKPHSPHPILNLGFRLFFLSAAVFAILSMLKWGHIIFATKLAFMPHHDMLPHYWHGHEMIYGYALAVIAGFLLTAVKVWTKQPMPYGYLLLAIFAPWALARLLFLANGIHINLMTWLAATLDIVFWLAVTYHIVKPIWTVRQKRQTGIVVKLLFLLIAHICFYIGLAQREYGIAYSSLMAGLFLVAGIVFTIGRRVMPMFIENGLGWGQAEKPTLRNSVWLDRGSLIGLVVFFIGAVFGAQAHWGVYLTTPGAALVATSNALRLKNWYRHGIWQRPLLWSLWLAMAGMAVGFALLAAQPWLDAIARSVALHAVALSGIGLMTLAMMARVSLGHTGRNIHQPPAVVHVVLICMALAWLARVVLGLLPQTYQAGLGLSLALWIVAFAAFCYGYARILCSPRVDGAFG